MNKFAGLFAAFLSLHVSAVFAQTCNDPSGFIKTFGTFNIGDSLVLGPDCQHVQSGSISLNLVVGSTQITGGADKQILFNNAGVLGSSPMATIGISTIGGPNVGLNVYPTASFNSKNGVSIQQGTGPNGSGGTMTFWAQNGPAGAPTAVGVQEIAFIQGYGWTGAAFGPAGNPTGIGFVATEAWTPAANGSGILFQATPNGTTAALNEMSIQNGVSILAAAEFTKTGLGLGTLNAENGLFDNGKRPFSANNQTISINTNAEIDFVVSNNSAGIAASTFWQANNGAGGALFGVGGTGYTTIASWQNRAVFSSGTGLSGIAIYVVGANPIDFYVNAARAGGFTSAGLFQSVTSVTSPSHFGGTAAGSTATINGTSNGAPASAFLKLQTNGQFTGVGSTANPNTLLDVNNNNTTNAAAIIATSLIHVQAADAANNGQEWVSFGAGASGGNIFAGGVAQGTAASPTATSNQAYMYNMRGYGYNSGWQVGALWIIRSDEPWSAGHQGTAQDFYTTPNASTTIAIALRLQASGGLSIGSGISTVDYGIGNIGVSGGLATAASTTKIANYTMTVSDSSLIFNGAGTLTVTLLNPASYPGRWVTLKTVAAQTVVSNSANVVPIAGGAAGTAILAATAGKFADLQSDGTNWIIMRSN